MKVSRFNKFNINESTQSCKASSLKGEVTLYRLTSHSVIDLKETGNYYVSIKSDLDVSILSKKGQDIFVITVKCDANNIQLDESEKECAKLNSSSVVYVKDDKKCKLVSVEPYSGKTNENILMNESKSIRVEKAGGKKYSFISIEDGDSKNGKEITLTHVQRSAIEKILNKTNEKSLIKESIYDLFAEFDHSKQKHLEDVMRIQNQAVEEGDERFAEELIAYYKKLSNVSANLMSSLN